MDKLTQLQIMKLAILKALFPTEQIDAQIVQLGALGAKILTVKMGPSATVQPVVTFNFGPVPE